MQIIGKSEILTPINHLGEFGLIDELKKIVTHRHPKTFTGIGDDAAIIDNGNNYLLLSTDMLVEAIHFDLSYTPLKHLGYKAVAINVSDILAMNGTPEHLTLSLGLSSKFSVEAIKEIYEGIYIACKEYNVDLVGGDTTGSKQGLILSVSITGSVEKNKLCKRDGAKVNNLVCVSGDLGAAYLGLQILEREKKVFLEIPFAEQSNHQPELEKYDFIIGRQLKPRARIDVIDQLNRLGVIPTSMIDISDGLSSELLHLCKQSEKGVVVYEEHLPAAPQTKSTSEELNLELTTCIMNGGEDYELLFTVDIAHHDSLKQLSSISIIGYITEPENGKKLITRSGQSIELIAQGWKHF